MNYLSTTDGFYSFKSESEESANGCNHFLFPLAFHLNSVLMFGYWQTLGEFINTKVTPYSLSAFRVLSSGQSIQVRIQKQ